MSNTLLGRLTAALACFATLLWQDLADLFQAGDCHHGARLPVDQGDHDACNRSAGAKRPSRALIDAIDELVPGGIR